MSVFVEHIGAKGFLSFGPDWPGLDLRDLNILIGPNASGKSNLIDIVGLFRQSPRDFAGAIREGGLISDWIWKGDPRSGRATVELVLANPPAISLRHRLTLAEVSQRVEILDEVVENERRELPAQNDVRFFYRFQEGRPVLNVRGAAAQRTLRREDVKLDQSVLAQRRDPDQYPEISRLATQYEQIRVYSEPALGRRSPIRAAQGADLPNDFLSEDCTNLALVLNELQFQPNGRQRLVEALQEINPLIEDVSIRVYGGSTQLFLHERGLSQPIPAKRLSDGTLRYLCLLAVLLHSAPPPLVCIEEPELGLHPDVLIGLGRLLREATERTQIIVTTHSPRLVDEFTDDPECVVVREHTDTGSSMKRLDSRTLGGWLDDYQRGLGQVWQSGQIGGNRW